MKNFVFSLILLSAIILGSFFNSYYARKTYDDFSEILELMPQATDPENSSGLSAVVKNFAGEKQNYFYITLPRTVVNDFYSDLEEMLGYFNSDDNASYKAYLSRIKLRIKQLRCNEEFKFF